MAWHKISAQLRLALIMMTKIKKWVRHSLHFQPSVVAKKQNKTKLYLNDHKLILHFCSVLGF